MLIKSSFKSRITDETVHYEYRDVDSDKEIGDRKISSVHGFCFCGDKLVVVYAEDKGHWTPPGGGVEIGETWQEALVREIKEETNMKVLAQKIIGVQDNFEPSGKVVSQTRSVCIVEPYGDFTKDPDGDITEIKLIDPKDYKKYFDWGENGDRIMERALELVKKMR